jgi:hypothetical protein
MSEIFPPASSKIDTSCDRSWRRIGKRFEYRGANILLIVNTIGGGIFASVNCVLSDLEESSPSCLPDSSAAFARSPA